MQYSIPSRQSSRWQKPLSSLPALYRQIQLWLNNQRRRALILIERGAIRSLPAILIQSCITHTRREEFPSRSQAYIYRARTKPKAHTRAHTEGWDDSPTASLKYIWATFVLRAAGGCGWIRATHAHTHTQSRPLAHPSAKRAARWAICWERAACNPSVSGAPMHLYALGRINYQQQAAVDFSAFICNTRSDRWLKNSTIWRC